MKEFDKYMWATIAAGFAARNVTLTAREIAAKTDEVIAEFKKRHETLEHK